MIAEIIKKARENPLQTFAWSIFTLCLACIVSLELSFPDRADYLEKANVDITESRMEIEQAQRIVDAYRESIKRIVANTESSKSFIDAKFPNITADDAKLVRDTLLQERHELTDVLAQLNTAHFENKAFVDLFRGLQQNVSYTDDFLAKRIEFMDLMMTDFDKARAMRPSIELGIAEERKTREIDARDAEIEKAFDKARLEHNAKVRTAQRKAELYKTQSRVKVAAFTYVGGFIGAWGGLFLHRLRKRQDPAT